MKETFSIPAVGGIIIKKVDNEEFVLLQDNSVRFYSNTPYVAERSN
jgi:hypothetical protein